MIGLFIKRFQFYRFSYQDFHWFTFNVADIFISFGIILMILNEIVFKK